MNKTRNIWIGLLAAFLSAFVVYGIYELQKMNVARQDTVAVVVPKRFISAGELLQTKDLEVRRLPSSAVDGDMLRELAEAQALEVEGIEVDVERQPNAVAGEQHVELAGRRDRDAVEA